MRQSVPGSCDHKESHAPKGTSSLHQTLFHSRGPGTLVGYLVVSRLESPGISRYRASGPAKKGALIPSSHTPTPTLLGSYHPCQTQREGAGGEMERSGRLNRRGERQRRRK